MDLEAAVPLAEEECAGGEEAGFKDAEKGASRDEAAEVLDDALEGHDLAVVHLAWRGLLQSLSVISMHLPLPKIRQGMQSTMTVGSA